MPQLDRPIALVSRPSPLARAIRLVSLLAITTLVFVFAIAVAVVALAD